MFHFSFNAQSDPLFVCVVCDTGLWYSVWSVFVWQSRVLFHHVSMGKFDFNLIYASIAMDRVWLCYVVDLFGSHTVWCNFVPLVYELLCQDCMIHVIWIWMHMNATRLLRLLLMVWILQTSKFHSISLLGSWIFSLT